MIKAFWVYPKGEEWVMLAFAVSYHEAKKIGFEHSPVSDDEAPYVEWRARRADDKWMKLAHTGKKCLTSCPMPYETWEDYWQAEYEKTMFKRVPK